MSATRSGGCLCGGVRYRVEGAIRPVVACHCEQCRRTSGHYFAATRARSDAFALERDETLRWYPSSPGVRRGFCSRCGSSLFFEREGGGAISIAAGTLDAPTGLRLVQHIYTDSAGDYYPIEDGLPRFAGSAPMPSVDGESSAPS